MEDPRAKTLAIWRQLRPLIVKLVQETDVCPIQMAHGRAAPHTDTLDLCDFLARQCECMRGDEGRAITWFLSLICELHNYIQASNAAIFRKDMVRNTLDEVKEAEITKIWTSMTRALSETFVLDTDPSKAGTFKRLNFMERFSSNSSAHTFLTFYDKTLTMILTLMHG